MQVAQPMIRRVRWELDPPRYERKIWSTVVPSAVAELEFPKGLRVGELWDLVTSHAGLYEPVWPSLDAPAPRMWHQKADFQWMYDRLAAADESMALILKYTSDKGLEAKVLETLRGYSPAPSLSVLRPGPLGSGIPWVFTKVSSQDLSTMDKIFY
ncbi:hypothetical protein F5B19DRAFT_462982 [Rostrohypoxylon terebratum]|nr:hypothetical protein F5B19DRAFT_462982 [Rostrohypoxylon terebratum]